MDRAAALAWFDELAQSKTDGIGERDEIVRAIVRAPTPRSTRRRVEVSEAAGALVPRELAERVLVRARAHPRHALIVAAHATATRAAVEIDQRPSSSATGGRLESASAGGRFACALASTNSTGSVVLGASTAASCPAEPVMAESCE